MKGIREKNTIYILLVFILSLNLLSCSHDEPLDTSKLSVPSFTNAVVHDPSIMEADGSYYVVGSHLASAKTDDLVHWEQLSTAVHNKNVLIPNVYSELEETFKWANSRTLWAGDWIYLETTGKYHMYYCACEGSSPRSALGMAVADSPEGPYKNVEILLYSGMWGEEAPDGKLYDPVIHPNAIDPHVFYDNEKTLWMVYGSYSGGIFILELDESTGLPKADQGYGKKLIGFNHSPIEGPYILYNSEHKMYYLFVSYGGLDSKGGYQVRVARSSSADGPYEDIMGQEINKAGGNIRLAAKYMQKMIGNFTWEQNTPKYANGYVSPGHNSAVYSNDLDKYFLIFHTRFPGEGEAHQVRVHEMFFTPDGWPVLAPFRYVGEDFNALHPISKREVIGDYQLINHGLEVNAAIQKPETISLKTLDSSWSIKKNNEMQITIDDIRFDGYFLWQWNDALEEYAITFTAVSQTGESIWGVKVND